MEPHPDSTTPPDTPHDTPHDTPPAWESDPRVRQALAQAFDSGPSLAEHHLANAPNETERALTRLRRVRDGQTPAGGARHRHQVPAAFDRKRPARGMPPASAHTARTRVRLALTVGGIGALLGFAIVSRSHLTWRQHTDLSRSRTYGAARGQRAAVTLPDGSNAVLAPETQLRYATDSRGSRIVSLTGEAFFTVTPHAEYPFIVRTGTVSTRVLGTAFDIRHYPGDHDTQVAVVTGRVAAQGRAKSAVLAAGSVARVTDSSVTVSPDADPERVAAWIQGRLIFHNTPVSTMLATLGRWYGYEFHLADTTLAASHVSIGFDADQPAEALNTVKAVLGVTMTFQGKVITLHPERERHNTSPRTRTYDVHGHPKPEVGR